MGRRRRGQPGEGRSALPGGSTTGAATDRLSWLALGLVGLLATLPYLNTFPNTFAFDDKLIFVEDPRIRSLQNLPTLLTTGYWTPNLTRGKLYRPLVTISYALNYALGGLHPFGYHLVNLLAHLGVSLLLYLLALRLFRHQEGALVAAALFAVHPLHTEAVTSIVGRTELFAAAFFLLAWWWYLKGSSRRWSRFASLGAFVLALFSKEHAITLPAVLFLSDLYVARVSEGKNKGGRAGILQDRPRLRHYAGYAAVLFASVLVRVAVIRGGGPPPLPFLDNPLAHVGRGPRLLTALEVAGRYLWLMVWPQRLSVDYSYNQIPIVRSLGAPGAFLSSLAWGGLIWAACRSYRGTRRAFLCVGFTLVTFSVASNFLIPIGTIMGERLFYLPSAGLCLLAGAGWQRLLEWCRGATSFNQVRRVGLGLLTMIVLLLAFRTVVRNSDWRNDETLFQSAVQAAPNSARVRLKLGEVYLEKGLTDAAVREFQASLAILPTAMAHHNLGTLYLRMGQLEEATAEYRKALTIDPRDADSYTSLGYVLLSRGLKEEAISALQKAVTFDPRSADAHYTLGRAFEAQGRLPQAMAAYGEARRLKPGFMEAAYALGLALEKNGQYREAAQALEEAVRLQPGLKAAHRRLAELYRARLGDPEKAREHLRQAEEGK